MEKIDIRVGEKYYFLDGMAILSTKFKNNGIDKNIFKNFIVFKTFEEAKEYVEYLKAKIEYIYRFSENDCRDENINKYFIFYDKKGNELFYDNKLCKNDSCKFANKFYFIEEERIQEFIDKYRKQILKFEFGV